MSATKSFRNESSSSLRDQLIAYSKDRMTYDADYKRSVQQVLAARHKERRRKEAERRRNEAKAA